MNTPTDQDVLDSIRKNANDPVTAPQVQNALIDGMSALINIESRLKTDSGIVNYQGIDIETLHNAYVDFGKAPGTIADSSAKRTMLGNAAQAMAAGIRTVMQTQVLSVSEKARLMSVLAEIVGSADLAEAYVGQMVAAPAGSTPPGGNPGNGGLLADGFVPAGDGNVPLDDGTNVPSMDDSNIVPNMDEGGENGYNKGKDPSEDLGIVEAEVSRERYPEATQHIQDAIESGQPEILTIDREGAGRNRRASLRGIKKIPGLDLDEYPPAMFKEGGEGASVRSIGRSDNRGAGSSIGQQLRPYPNGTKVKIVLID